VLWQQRLEFKNVDGWPPNAPFAERVDEASSSTIGPRGRVDIPLINNAGLLTINPFQQASYEIRVVTTF
jgi:hypothetical protein